MAQTDIGIRLSLTGQNEVTGGLDRVKAGLSGMESAASNTLRSVQGLGTAMGAAFSVGAFVKAADAVTVLNNQLKLATGSAQAASSAYASLYDIAQRSRVSFTELGGTFASIARAGDQLGISQQRLLGVTEAISNAVAISGGSADSARASLVQLSQGLASGTLRGDELNSVMEQTPRLAKALADGLGVTTGELRKLGEAGEITADKVIKALESQSSVLSGEVKNSVVTVGQAWTQLGNATTKAIGEWDAASGASATLASAMQGLAGAVDSVGKFAAEHKDAIAYVTAGLAGAATIAGISALGVGLYSAAGAVEAFGAAWLATPLGPIIAGLALVAAGVASVSAAAKNFSQSEVGLSVALSDIDEKINRLQNSGRKLSEAGQANLDKYKAQRAAILRELALSGKDDGSFDSRLDRSATQAKASAAEDKANAAAIEKARALVKTKNTILDAGYKEAVTIAQGYQGAIEKAQGLGNNDEVKRLTAERSALLIASAKETEKAIKSFVGSDTKKSDEAARQRKAAADFLGDLQAQAKAAETVTAQMGELSELQKAMARADEMVREGRVREQDLDREAIANAAKRIDAAKALKEENEKTAKAQATYLDKLGDAGSKEVASLEQRVAKQAQHNAEIGKTAEQIESARRVAEEAATQELEAQEQAITALLEKNAALLDYGDTQGLLSGQSKEIYELEVKSLREQIALRKQLAKGFSEGEQLEAGAAAAKATAAEWKRGWEETDKLARDAFTAWAENGTSMADAIGKSLKKALLSAIYEATLKPIAFQLYTSIAGGGGAAGAVQAASGAGNALSGGSSLLTGLFSAGGPIASGITNIGAAMINGPLSSLVGDLGASLVANSTAIANAVPYVGTALVAIKALTDYTVKANGSALVANLGGGVTNVANRNDYIQSSWRNGDQNNSEWSAASADLTAYMDAQVKLVTESARAYGTALGLPVADLDSFKQQIEVSLTGLNADQAKEAINKAIGGFGDALVSANFGPALDGLKRSGETSSATLARVATEITVVNNTLGMLGGKLLSVDAAGIKAADGLVQAMGGLEAFQSATASYYESYYSAEEKRLNTAKNIQTQLANAGVEVTLEQVLNGTKEQFRALVESFTTDSGNLDEAGQKAVAALMAVAGAFAGIATASASAASAATVPTESSFGSGVGSSGPSQSGWSGPSTGASEAANAILEERKSLQDQLDELTMTNTQLLEKQRNAIDESNRALWDQVQAAKAAAAAAEERKSLQEQYNQLTMTETQLRELERETIAESNRELFDRITAIKAEQAAIAEANTAVDNAFAAVQRAIDAEKRGIEATRQAAQERVNIIGGIVNTLGDVIDDLRGNVDGTQAAAAARGNAFITDALATAKASGYLPDPSDLKDAIADVRKSFDVNSYATQFEYEKAQLVLAGKLEGLKDVADPQLTAAKAAVTLAEAQLKALDDQLAAAQESINVLRGIDTSIMSVEAALAALAVALGVAESAGVGGSGGAVTINPGDYQANGTSTGALSYIGESTGGLSNDFWKSWSTHMQNVYGEDAGYKVYNMAIERGVSSTQLEEILGMSAGQANAWALAHGLASFDVGTDYVPKTGIAMIHEGEKITPRAFNPAAGGVSGNARLESLVEVLTQRFDRMAALMEDVKDHTGKFADQFDTVTAGGNAMLMETA